MISRKPLTAVTLSLALACCGCSSGTADSPPPATTPILTQTGMATGRVTLDDMCKAFEASAGQNLAKVTQYCANAPTFLQNGNADAHQCVVILGNASKLANNNIYSLQQAYDACNAYNTSDPVGAEATLPGADTMPLNPDHQSLDH